MKNIYLHLLIAALCLFSYYVRAQVVIQKPLKADVSIPLREMTPEKRSFFKKIFRENEEKKVPNRFRNIPVTPGVPPDPALQTQYPGEYDRSVMVTPIVNFNGLTNANNSGRVTPPDVNGDVGPNHYVQVVNCMLQMFNKSGTSVYGPVTTSTIWNGFSGNWSGHNDGDAVVLYDENADRWIISQFAIDCGTYPNYTEYELVAVSTSPDPTGTYYRYAFAFDYMPDYPKLSVWQDGYYMAVNRFNTNSSSTPFIGAAACVMERSKMLTGDPSASMIYFKTETLGGSGSGLGSDCWSMLPSDCDGTWAPAGTPNYFTYFNDNSWGGNDELRIWGLWVNWTTPASSTFTFVTALPVTSFTLLGSGISQSGTSNKLDNLGDRLMFRNQYRNFGTYGSFVTCHSVDAGSGVAGVRWYEYRKTGTTFSLYQQATYNPGDGKSRWMGSIAMNANGDIGLVYTVCNNTMFPSIYFTGRKVSDPVNQMTQTESIIQTGTVAMTGATRWGDYASINIDPSDNNTFWATNEYVGTYGGTWPWATKIASFKFSNMPTATTAAATGVTVGTATLNGTVNPNGLATTYNFQWGTTTSYGNTTTTTSAGSGVANVPASAAISGLVGGTTYHYRVTATNTDGTAYGSDMTFVPGAAVVTTTTPVTITNISAVSGGNVTADGGSTVSARGVCWGTTANPVVTGSHTTDGSGTGVFTSNITGLSPNTTYHVRAYATNGTGTYYGIDIVFTTLCNTSTLPFSESFTGTTLPSCWSNIDNGTNGQIWQFGVITGQSPNPSLTGNYAYLNSDAYGSGNSQNADLITPTIDMTGYSTVTLAFSHYFKAYTGSSGTLSYSINNGSTWTAIQTFTTTSATNPATFSQVIAGVANQSQVKFKWNYTGSYGYYWAIDNISITGTSALTLSVSPSNQNVTSTAGSTTFNVTSNSSWTVTSNQGWCTVTPSGSGNGVITANYTANTGTTSRVANITVTVTGLAPVIVTVTQAGVAPTLTVSPANQNVPETAGNTSFTVTSNSAWNVTSNQTWCTVTPSGNGNGTITATYAANTSTTSRVANITTTVTGLSPVVVTVTQAGAAPTLSVTPPTQNVTDTAGTTTFTVTSNSAWTATSNQGWCTVTPSGTGNGYINANYTVNTTTSPRTASVTVTVTGISPVVVTVVQAGAAPFLTVTPPNQNAPAAPASSVVFNVSANISWTAVSSDPWCTVTPSGNGNATLTANYTENLSTSSRVATITVSGPGVSNQTVMVTQNGTAPTLSVTPSNQNVTAPAGSTSFNVTSNSSWTAVSDADWCLVTTSGSGNGQLMANYTENTATTQRIANITVTVAGLPEQIVTVTQAGAAPTLAVTPSDQYVDASAGYVSFDVASNSQWTAASDAGWCTVTPSGTGAGSIVANYTQNSQPDDRLANITVTVAGIAPQVVKLHQSHVVGIPSIEGQTVALVPNPTSGQFRIVSEKTKMDVTILDLHGRTLLKRNCETEKDLAFDFSEVAKGMYLVKITMDNGAIVQRLIINR